MKGLDYRGELVLAAYEPMAELNLGIVAKIDLAEGPGPLCENCSNSHTGCASRGHAGVGALYSYQQPDYQAPAGIFTEAGTDGRAAYWGASGLHRPMKCANALIAARR